MKSYHLIPLTIALLLSCAVSTLAAPDRYIGDTSIYGAAASSTTPNVLFIIDNNSTMGTPAVGAKYVGANLGETTGDHITVYPGTGSTGAPAPYSPWNVYKKGGQGNWVNHLTNDINFSNISCTAARDALLMNGTYSSSAANGLKSNGTCGNGGAQLVYLGNLLNYNNSPPTVGTGTSQIQLVRESIEALVTTFRENVRFGVAAFGANNKGGVILHPVGSLTTDTNYNAFKAAMYGNPLLTGETRPLAESLLDVAYYFKLDRGSPAYTTLPISGNPAPASPITNWCQKNFVILISNGDTIGDNDPKLAQIVGDRETPPDGPDGMESSSYGAGSHYLDDVADYAYDTDLSSSLTKSQSIQTFTIQVFAPYKELLARAADASHGRGSYEVADTVNKLHDALDDVMNRVLNESDSSFVAPVVPSSPENRSYSGKRVYLGFFRPVGGENWRGNLKKYGIDSNNNITDSQDPPVHTTIADGSFDAGAISFWSTEADAGRVEAGGTGEVLHNRDIIPSDATARMRSAADPRKIYTYLGDINLSSASSSAFDTDNTALTTTHLDVASEADATGARDKLIRLIHGLDSYDINANGVGNEIRTWILGDILHSKPLLVNYKRYSFNRDNERDASLNKTYMFVGANDGMLHAFRDVDGVEEWAFIPPGLLPDLKYLRPGESANHSYFVDNSAVTYIHDANNDGEISGSDKVILIFGTRRGGGKDTLADVSRGAYYALDVSDPTAPKFMRKIDRTTSADFVEMGETWSTPRLAKIKVNGVRKIVAFIGAGYDNNEDLRFGNTQTFPPGVTSLTDVSARTSDFTTGRSEVGGTQVNPKGRGIFAIEIATLNASGNTFTPDFTNLGTKLWKYTFAENAAMTFSVPSDITALDRDMDGFVDRLYVGDTGGNLWRFNVGNDSIANWTGTKIFSANPGGESSNPTSGRKIFYRPAAAVLDSHTVSVFFGTGDRAHPQNHLNPGEVGGATLDRLYHVWDRDNAFDPNTSKPAVLTEANLVDVTSNQLQRADTTAETITSLKEQLLQGGSAANGYKYGWYIKLNAHAGEKVLAPATVFNGSAFFTTYTPDLTVVSSEDACEPGANPGTSRMYAVNMRTGEATYNFDNVNTTDAYGEGQTPSADEISGYTANVAAGTEQRHLGQDKEGNIYVLRRADRETLLGRGIPSGLVFILGEDGKTSALAGSGGSFPSLDIEGDGLITPLYWMQW